MLKSCYNYPNYILWVFVVLGVSFVCLFLNEVFEFHILEDDSIKLNNIN